VIDHFDSRALGRTDCYGQRFMKTGTYRYNVLPAGGDALNDERPFVIQVKERSASNKMNQHTVFIKPGPKMTVEPPELAIEAGDLVLWNCATGPAMPCMVVGDKEFFNSARLVNESGYSHAFGTAGEYEWVDAYGSGARGVVRVRHPECKSSRDYQQWREQLSRGTVVMISDAKAEPREVEIMTGQTVFFGIVKGPGISITDKRLVIASACARDAQAYRREASADRR